MDDNRIVNGLAEQQRADLQVGEAAQLRGELDDGPAASGYRRQRRAVADEQTERHERRPAPREVPDPETSQLVAALDRLRQTDDEVQQEVRDVRQLRGRYHYREKDPETSRIYRRQPPSDPRGPPPSPPGEALEPRDS